jgi:KaiC/GvpD/RAD55 family RecA-like ATPase
MPVQANQANSDHAFLGGSSPHNIEAEQCLLGAIFINNEAFIAITGLVYSEDFFEPLHRTIFEICATLITERRLVSPVTIKGFLSSDLKVEGLTINQYLARLSAEGTTVINAPDYAKLVRDLADRRRLIAAAEKCTDFAMAPEADVPPEEIAAETVRRIEEIVSRRLGTVVEGIPLSAAEFLELKLPPRQRIIEPWLPEKGLVLIYSPRGTGKTLFATTSAYAIAVGADFLGFKTLGVPRKVLYVDGEMPAEVMQERLAAIVGSFQKRPPTDDHFRLLSSDLSKIGLPDLGTDEGQAWLDVRVRDAEVLYLDNLSTLVRSGRENEAEGWLPMQNWVLKHRRAGRSVIMVHHAGKGGAQRGTSRREDVLDTVISLRRPSDYTPDQGARFEVHFEKARGFLGQAAQPFEAKYELRDGKALWTRTEMFDAQRMRVSALLKDGTSIRDTAEELRMTKSKVERIRKKLVEDGEL